MKVGWLRERGTEKKGDETIKRSEFLTTANMKITLYWDLMPWSPVDSYLHSLIPWDANSWLLRNVGSSLAWHTLSQFWNKIIKLKPVLTETYHINTCLVGPRRAIANLGAEIQIQTKQTNSLALVRNELYQPNDRHLSEKLVPTVADRECCVVSSTDPYGRFGLLDRSSYFFFQVAPQLYSWGWVDHVPDPLLLRKSGSAGNRTQGLWICNKKFWTLDHRGVHPNSEPLKYESRELASRLWHSVSTWVLFYMPSFTLPTICWMYCYRLQINWVFQKKKSLKYTRYPYAIFARDRTP
jgi:hypothetical protein